MMTEQRCGVGYCGEGWREDCQGFTRARQARRFPGRRRLGSPRGWPRSVGTFGGVRPWDGEIGYVGSQRPGAPPSAKAEAPSIHQNARA